MDKNIQMSMLLQVYGKILTKKQYETVDLYYNQNLSLSEIGENLEITRQGVRENLRKAENKLLEMEEKLNLLERKRKQQKIIEEILEKVEQKELKEKLEELLS